MHKGVNGAFNAFVSCINEIDIKTISHEKLFDLIYDTRYSNDKFDRYKKNNVNSERDKLKQICEKLNKKYIVIDGNVVDKPAELKKDFDVVIGQYQAFSESLDGLQYKCHLMVFYSMPDSSLSYKQSLGRIDRIGQKHIPTYYHLIMEGTIDDKIYSMLKNKVEFSEKDLNEVIINMILNGINIMTGIQELILLDLIFKDEIWILK